MAGGGKALLNYSSINLGILPLGMSSSSSESGSLDMEGGEETSPAS